MIDDVDTNKEYYKNLICVNIKLKSYDIIKVLVQNEKKIISSKNFSSYLFFSIYSIVFLIIFYIVFIIKVKKYNTT